MIRRIITWDNFDNYIKEAVELVRNSRFDPEVIVGIPRGGLTPAVCISHQLGVPLFVPYDADSWGKIKDKRILVVDDISDTGKELQLQLENAKTAACTSVKSLTLVTRKGTRTVPDFTVLHLNEEIGSPDYRWIVFPWERRDSIGRPKNY